MYVLYLAHVSSMSVVLLLLGQTCSSGLQVDGAAAFEDGNIEFGRPTQGRVLITTGFWSIKSKKGSEQQSEQHYSGRMHLVMGLNASMMIYGDAVGLSLMVSARQGREPPLMGREQVLVDELPPCGTHGDTFKNTSKEFKQQFTHRVHMPSIELGCVWSSKISLLQRSFEKRPRFDWYVWMDVGFHNRENYQYLQSRGETWPNPDKLDALPKGKVIVSLSSSSHEYCDKCTSWHVYCHCLSGTAFIVPRSLVSWLATLFTHYQDRCLKERPSWICLNDQVVMTHVRNDFPDMFLIAAGLPHGSVVTSAREQVHPIVQTFYESLA